ncbi:MAG TPA: hypothetical protein VN132_02685, partial [Bdellovibrio sp.]|nr:hypothetical protein [Bdellovibrio sp.]
MKFKVFLLTMLSFSIAKSVVPHGGESSGGGGNSSAAEFQMIGVWTVNALSQRGEIRIKNRLINLSAMSLSLMKLKIQPTDENLVLNGAPVSAINYPEQHLIVFNEDNWKSLDRIGKMQLCLHEIWGLTFADHADDNYIFSAELARMVSASSFENSSQIISAQSTDTDLDGQSYRALVTKMFVQNKQTYQIIFEKIFDMANGNTLITSHIVYNIAELPINAKWGFQNLRLSSKGFEFELDYFLPDQMTCLFPLPSVALIGIELEKVKIDCHA